MQRRHCGYNRYIRKWHFDGGGTLRSNNVCGNTVVCQPGGQYIRSQKSIEQKQQEIKNAQNQKKQLQSGMTDVQSIISDLEQSKKNLCGI